jgi:chromate transporter
MRNDPATLAALFLQFGILSFFAIGGASTAVPEIHRQSVEIAQWLTDRQFSELFALAQAAPGPNVMFVALLGHFIAGVPGAVVATVAMCGPTCFLAYGVSRVFERFREARWRIVIQAGLVPVTVGLIAASALIIAQGGRSRLGRLRCHGGDGCVCLLDPALAAGGVRVRSPLGLGRIRVTGCNEGFRRCPALC